MSKSKGNSMDPFDLHEKYGADPLRYYLTKVIPSADDGAFSEKELVEKYNNELGNDLGNLVMRCVKLSLKNIGEKVEAPEEYSNELKEFQERAFEDADKFIHKFEYDRALNSIWAYVKKINVYMTEKEPWKVEDKEEFHKIMYTALDNLANATALLEAYLPSTALKIESQLGVKTNLDNFYSQKSFSLTDADPLFPKIEWTEKEYFPLDLKVATIESVEKHPDADKLLVLQVSLGKEKRQLVAGLAEYYKPEELEGKNIVMLTNLESAKLRGVESQGMMLAGEKGKEVKAVFSDKPAGTQVGVEGFETNEDQITFKDFQKVKLKIKDHNILYQNKPLKADSDEVKSELESGAVY